MESNSKSEEDQNKPTRFCIEKLEKSQSSQIRGHLLCYGTRGITWEKSLKHFGTLDMAGFLTFWNEQTGKKSKEVVVPSSTIYSHPYSSFHFSPNARNFLVSVQEDKTLFVFNSVSFKLVNKLTNKWANGIRQAKWFSEQEILASFSHPGELLLYRLGRSKPTREIRPKIINKSWVTDFELSQNRKLVYCGTQNGLVFSMELGQNHEEIKWSRLAEEQVNSVGLSEDQKFLCVSTDGRRVLVISCEDGSLLSSFNGFSDEYVLGAVWVPWSNRIVAMTINELVLLKSGMEDGKPSEKMDELKKETIGKEIIFAMSGVAKRQRELVIMVGDKEKTFTRVFLE